jgi:hypothetical protein
MTHTLQDCLDEALVQAAIEGNVAAVKGLVALGADIHWRKELPLRQAALHEHELVFKELRLCGATVSDAILAAASVGNVEEVATLINLAPETTVVSTLRQVICPRHPAAGPFEPSHDSSNPN